MPIVLAPVDTELMVLKIVANQDIKRHLEDLGILVGTKASWRFGNHCRHKNKINQQ